MTDSVFDTLEALSKKADRARIQAERKAEEDREVLQNFVLLCKMTPLDAIPLIEEELCRFITAAEKVTIFPRKDSISIDVKSKYAILGGYVHGRFFIDDMGKVTIANENVQRIAMMAGTLVILCLSAISFSVISLFGIIATILGIMWMIFNPIKEEVYFDAGPIENAMIYLRRTN